MARPGEKSPLTTTARIREANGVNYITVPPDWPYYAEDIVDIKVTFADVDTSVTPKV